MSRRTLTGQYQFGYWDFEISGAFIGPNIQLTPEGGFAVKHINKTGVPTVKGKLARYDTATDGGVILTGADDTECMGVFYDAGIPDGEDCWVIYTGKAQVLLKDNTAGTHGNWVKTSDEAGYADATGTSPAAAPTHFEEIGHCGQSVSANGGGTHVLCLCMINIL